MDQRAETEVTIPYSLTISIVTARINDNLTFYKICNWAKYISGVG